MIYQSFKEYQPDQKNLTSIDFKKRSKQLKQNLQGIKLC